MKSSKPNTSAEALVPILIEKEAVLDTHHLSQNMDVQDLSVWRLEQTGISRSVGKKLTVSR